VLALSMALSKHLDGERHPATLVWIVERGCGARPSKPWVRIGGTGS
jgi:hypothetical protein